MRFIFILLLFPYFTFPQQTVSDSIVHNNVTRHFTTYIPAAYNSSISVPLLFNTASECAAVPKLHGI